MKRFSILTQVLIITLVVSACGAKATPTAVPIDIPGTVAAGAATMVAETQAAIPTSTPLPPTPTATQTNIPLPTNTFLPVPTEGVASTAQPGAGDPCVNNVLPASLTGQKIKIRVDNPTKGTINLTVYLQSGNPQGVCGYRGYTLDAGGSLVINDLVEGCYSLWAWNPDPKGYFMVTNGTSCLDSSNTSTFDISKNGISLR